RQLLSFPTRRSSDLDTGVNACLHHGRLIAVNAFKPGGPLTSAVAEVPVEALREDEPLSRFKAKRVNVGDEDQKARKSLARLRDAELGCLLDLVRSEESRGGT